MHTHTHTPTLTHTYAYTHVQALLEGFNDHHAVENYISQNVRGRLQTDGEKIKVDIGTLRTKVLVQESKTMIIQSLFNIRIFSAEAHIIILYVDLIHVPCNLTISRSIKKQPHTGMFLQSIGACDLYTWGSGLRGMLGHKDEDNEKLPRVVESLLGRDISMVACGLAHTMALSGKPASTCMHDRLKPGSEYDASRRRVVDTTHCTRCVASTTRRLLASYSEPGLMHKGHI